MPESFDKQISNKIRSTFENYQEPFNNDAWELMKLKLPSKKNRQYVLFVNIAKAASVILIIGIAVLFPFRTNHQFSEKNNSLYIDSTVKMNAPSVNYNLEHNTENKILFKAKLIEKQIIENNDSIIIEKVENPIIALINTEIVIDTVQNNLTDSVENNKPILYPDNTIKNKKSEKRFNYGIAVNSYYSSSEIGANDNINIGGGFQAEYKLTNLISFSSGVILANHHLNTESTNLLGSLKSYDAAEVASDANFIGNTETEIYLTGLDIPLNVKLNFEKIYLSAGVSSLVYLKENKTESYLVENYKDVYNPETNAYYTSYDFIPTEELTESKAFQTIDFAKLLNLSFGYKIPLKKGRFVIEPYAKIPIAKLTAYQISYGYGGISLKYDF
jgi:hypothetical protein